jgi:parvulin-like peptidyl-prolyl isomerase
MPPNSSPAQTLTPPSTGLPMRTSPAPAGGQFAVENMDQDIWGPPLAKPSRPSATPSPSEAKPFVPRVAAANRDTAAAAVAAAAAPSSAPVALTPPVASATTARNVTSRDGDFEPTGSMMPPAGVAASRPSPAPPAYAGRSTAAPSAVVLPEQKLSSSGEPAAAPFGGDPQVALLDSAVLHESLEPSANALVHGTLDEGTRVLAIVGDQSILAGDVLGQINEMLAPYRSQASEMELADQREKIIQEMLPRLIERKLIFYDFLKQIPIDKLPEIEQEVYKHFNEKRLPEILEKTGLKSAAEFDAQLRSLGSSLANQQRLFFEQMVAAEAVQREARGNDEVSHDEMLSYYNEHLADFSFPAKVRWERLAVDPSRFPTPEQAYNVLARMGNEVFHGANFADVARRSSHGPKAAEGGQHHWTTQGSLVNKEIDRLLFMLPEGQLSKVVKSDSMYQILRVVERVEAGTKPFIAMQNEIVEKIKKQRFDKRVEAYLARLRDETYVWTSGGDAAPTQVAQPVAGELMR